MKMKVTLPPLIGYGRRSMSEMHIPFMAITRLVDLVTHDPEAQLVSYSRTEGRYVVHPLTREILRDVLARLARSGKGEEPLWE